MRILQQVEQWTEAVINGRGRVVTYRQRFAGVSFLPPSAASVECYTVTSGGHMVLIPTHVHASNTLLGQSKVFAGHIKRVLQDTLVTGHGKSRMVAVREHIAVYAQHQGGPYARQPSECVCQSHANAFCVYRRIHYFHKDSWHQPQTQKSAACSSINLLGTTFLRT